MAMDSFRHRPPNQRRQGQAAPERHRRRTVARPGPSAGRPSGAGRPSVGGGRRAQPRLQRRGRERGGAAKEEEEEEEEEQ